MTEQRAPSGVWAVRPGHEHNHIDGRTHVHHIHLFNQVTGGEHNIDLLLHVPKCRECGRAFPSGKAPVDIAASVAQDLQNEFDVLEKNHAEIMAYAAAAGLPIKLGALASLRPPGHSLIAVGGLNMLRVPRLK